MFSEDNPDHRILSIAYDLHKTIGDRKSVVLVTKDVNMRMKAKALGILAEDYTTDRVQSIDGLNNGKEIVSDVADEYINTLYQAPFELPIEPLSCRYQFEWTPNKYFI